MIRVQNYTKAYRETLAVHDLSFQVPSGAILGLVGQNGAGKTTTLRAIAGIIPPTGGQLFVADHNVVKSPQNAKQNLAYIPDEPRLFDSLTVWEHIRFNASAYQVEGWQDKATQLLEQFELLDKKDATARELSRGMRQKVAICCGFLHDPSAILFDEPHTGLDPQGIRTMKHSVEKRAANGSAVIVSSHLLSLIEDLCTHLLILAQGKSLFFGPLEALRAQYPDLGDDNSLEQIFLRATADGHSLNSPASDSKRFKDEQSGDQPSEPKES